jgi:hypothetical protein
VWLGRWIAGDSAGLADGPNLYLYVRNSPIKLADPTGTRPPTPEEDLEQIGDPATARATSLQIQEQKKAEQKELEQKRAEESRREAEQRQTPEYQQAFGVGKQLGSTLAEFENALEMVQKKRGSPGELLAGGGKSLWETMSDKEKVDWFTNASKKFADLPQVTEYSDAAKTELARKGYVEGVGTGYRGRQFSDLLLKVGVEAAIFLATALALRAGIQRALTVPVPKNAVIHVGAELDALPGEVIVNPGRQAMPIEALRQLHPDKMVIQAGVEKMPFRSGVASLIKGSKLPAGSIDWKAAAGEINRVLMSGGRVDIAVMGDLTPLRDALQKLGWTTINLHESGSWLTAVKP